MTSTLNRRILHGAREHDREGVFVYRNGASWDEVPDWRADRQSIRIALVLAERLGVSPGDSVALSMKLRPELPLIERAVWGLSAISVLGGGERSSASSRPVVVFSEGPLDDPPASAKAVIVMGEDYRKLVDDGGVLDTPERATRFRAEAAETPPEALATIEGGEEHTHASWVARLDAFTKRYPPERGTTRILCSDEPGLFARTAVYAIWSGGVERFGFAAEFSGSVPDGFVRLSPEGNGSTL